MKIPTLIRALRFPYDCTGRVAYVRRTLKVATGTALASLLLLRYAPMGNTLAFATAALFVYSVMLFCIEFYRGNWRAGSFCRHHELIENYGRLVEVTDDYETFEASAGDPIAKLRCVTCGRIELR